jgi:hypothetical protein
MNAPDDRPAGDRHRFTHEAELHADDPGAPPGYLLDLGDHRTGTHVHDDGTGCAEEVPPDWWDSDPPDQLARGAGER